MIILFCGIPGSGKTTIARKLANLLRRRYRVKLFISDKLAPPVYKKFLMLLRAHAGTYDILLFDATFYKEVWRRHMISYARKKKQTVFLIYLVCSVQTALLRNKKRRPNIPERAVHIISHALQKPRHTDVTINTESVSPTTAVQRILRKLKRRLQRLYP